MINQPMGYYDRTKSATYNLTPTDFENFSNRQLLLRKSIGLITMMQ